VYFSSVLIFILLFKSLTAHIVVMTCSMCFSISLLRVLFLNFKMFDCAEILQSYI